MAILRLESVSKSYACKGKTVKALDGVSLSVERSEFIAILGPSGAGKTTLLNIAGLMDRPDSGKYFLDSSDTAEFAPARRAELLARKTGFIFQAHNLLPYLTAGENVGLGLHYSGLAMDGGYIRELFKLVGLEGLEDRKPAELSAGQQQRVAIARAMAKRPELILADEPTGNLDEAAAGGIMRLFRELNRLGATVLLVTHNRGLAGQASRVIEMSGGRIVSDTRQAAESGGEDSGAVVLPLPAGGARGGGPWGYAARSAFRNICRHPLKNLFILIVIAAGTYLMNTTNPLLSEFDPQKNMQKTRQDTIYAFPNLELLAGNFSREDIKALTEIKEMKSIYPVFSAYARSAGNSGFTSGAVYGLPPALAGESLKLVAGRALSGSGDGMALVDVGTAQRLWGSVSAAVGKPLVFPTDKKFRIAGVFDSERSALFMSEISSNSIVLSEQEFIKLNLKGSRILALHLQIASVPGVETAMRQVRLQLNKNHGIRTEDVTVFKIVSGKEYAARAGKKYRMARLFLYHFLLIPYLLAGVFMVNLLLTSISERRFETGLFISLGSNRWEIVILYSLEILILVLAGWSIGCLSSSSQPVKYMFSTLGILSVISAAAVALPIYRFISAGPSVSMKE